MNSKKNIKIQKFLSKKYLFGVFLFTAVLLLPAIFFITRGDSPYTSELSFVEHSVFGSSAGSVIPASCDSNGDGIMDMNGPCPVNGVCSSPHYACAAGNLINAVSSGSSWTWGCQGLYGGSDTNSCMAVKPTGTLTADPSSCLIVTSSNSCTVNVTWLTSSPDTTSSITTNTPAPNTVLYTANSGGPSPVALIGTGVKTFYLYNSGIELASQTVSASCAVGGWDTISSTCVNPLVDSVVVTGQYYSTPGNVALTCSNSDSYKVLKDGTLFKSGAYTGTVNVAVSDSANYSIICTKGSYDSDPTVKYYNSPPPPPPVISIVASPRTIVKNVESTLSWSVQFPIPTCALTAKVVCAGTCTASQLADEAALNQRIVTEKTDASDPYGSRSITSAVKTMIPTHINTDWKGFGKKTFKISNTTDFTITCGVTKSATRVRVTQSNEQ